MKKQRNFHPLLFAVYPVLFLYSQNIDITPLSNLALPLLVVLIAYPIVWLFFNLSLKDRTKSALLTTIFLILFFSFGHVHSFIYSFFLESEVEEGGRHVSLLVRKRELYISISVFYVLLLELAHFWLKRAQPSIIVPLTNAANTMAAALCIMTFLNILLHWSNTYSTVQVSHPEKSGVAAEILDYKPDIYYIILDGYAREDTLKKHYDFDNSEFLNFLRQNGFEIMSKSRSNFFWTFLSLSSSLNMEYVTDLGEKLGKTSTEMRLPYRMIRDNEVAHFLRSKGYRFVHLDSTWGATMVNPFADMEVNCGTGIFQIEFYRVLMESSWLKFWESPVSVDLASCHLANFHKLAAIATLKGPKFVFAHFIPPPPSLLV